MDDHMHELEQELRLHGNALRGLARDLVGAGDADDVVQEAALQALRAPRRPAGAFGAWLAGILRHVALRHRRTLARQRTWDQLAVRAEVAPADAGHDDADQLRFLTDAVLALPAPYRSAVFARYLKGLEPAAIAAQTGEPVATVKTRLKRGLALLRERFDARARERGGDWRAGLAFAFALPRPTAAAAVIGGTLMTAGTKWGLAAGAAALLVAGWFAFGPFDARVVAPAPPEQPTIARADSMPANAVAAPAAAPSSPAPNERTAAAPVDVVSRVVVRGRCVDEAGRTLAGVHARFRGSGDDEQVAAWSRQHGELPKVDERMETAADGAFAFRFASLPPYFFSLELGGDGLATWHGHWSGTPFSDTGEDLGDVVLVPGTRLRGRVVDPDGAPAARVEVRVRRADERYRERGVVQSTDLHTRVDGTFADDCWLPAGEYKLDVDGLVIASPVGVVLVGEPERFLEIVLRRPNAGEAIRGIVVDDDGAPVQGANIHLGLSGTFRTITTRSDGRFEVLRRAGMPDRVRLMAQANGHEFAGTDEPIEWGRSDVRLVAAKGRGVTVSAVRASDGCAVEDYELRVMPWRTPGQSSSDFGSRGRSPHAGGREAVTGLRAGTHHVVVVPASDELAIGVAVLDTAASGASPVVVRLAATAPRTVHVQRADGSPVANADVQLVDPLGHVLDESLAIRAVRDWSQTTADKAMVIAAATTDARGDVVLRAPADRPLGLNLPGPQHMSLLVRTVAFPDDRPFVVTVQSGAILRASVDAAALAEMRRLSGLDGKEPFASNPPSIHLQRMVGTNRERFPDLATLSAMSADGAFELRGVPPGRWRVVVSCITRDDIGAHWLEQDGGQVDLVDGETKTFAIDLAAMLPGELEGLVLHNGVPLAGTCVRLEAPAVDHPDNEPMHVRSVTTDAQGRFRTKVRGGDWRLVWSRGPSDWFGVTAPERARVATDKATSQTFTLRTGRVEVRAVDAAGKPAANVELRCRDANDAYRLAFPATDAEGRTVLDCEVVPFTVWALPKRLQSEKAQREWRQAHMGEPDPIGAALVRLAPVLPRAGETIAVELRLPAEWER